MNSLDELNFHHLYYFWVVAQEGSVTAASRRLGLAQPSVSAQLKKLEEVLGRPLFERAGRGRRLSDFGRLVQSHADRVFGAAQQLIDSLYEDGGVVEAPLSVGVCETVSPALARRVLAPLSEGASNTSFTLRRGRFEELVADLESRRFDVLVSQRPVGDRARVAVIDHHLGESGLSFVGDRRSLADSGGDFPGMLDGATLLEPPSEYDTRRALRAWLSNHGVRPKISDRFTDAASLVEFGSVGSQVFTVPTLVENDVVERYGLGVLGRTEEVRETFYAIVPADRVGLPEVRAIFEARSLQAA